MTQVGDPIIVLAGLLLLLLILALVWAGSRRPYVREVERLKDELHKLLSSAGASGRLSTNGRPSAFASCTTVLHPSKRDGSTKASDPCSH